MLEANGSLYQTLHAVNCVQWVISFYEKSL